MKTLLAALAIALSLGAAAGSASADPKWGFTAGGMSSDALDYPTFGLSRR